MKSSYYYTPQSEALTASLNKPQTQIQQAFSLNKTKQNKSGGKNEMVAVDVDGR
jgi:hypothetical protein